MSADNFYLIRRVGSRYAVTMEFASSDPDLDPDASLLARATAKLFYPTPIDGASVRWFDSLALACTYADAQYSEYGTQESLATDAANDTFAARLTAAARELVRDFPEESLEVSFAQNHHADETVELHVGDAFITISAPTFDEAFALSNWITATLPGSLAHNAQSSN